MDIITIGSATKDFFLDAKNLKKGADFVFPLGEKIELENVDAFSGGGGVNTATTFALQGLATGFCGVIGQDMAGQTILEELNELNINTDLVKTKIGQKTDLGIVFHAESERTILLFHGASRTMTEKDIDWDSLRNTSWLYLAPLWNKAAELTEKLVSFAKENKIRVAFNPSLDQLKLKNIKEIVNQVDVLLLNSDEACFLARIKPYQDKAVFSSICSCVRLNLTQVVIVTKGKDGATAFDGKFIYQVPTLPVKVIDATGAGDSFGSGFVAGLIQNNNAEKALQLAMSNALANIKAVGANQGLLLKNQPLLKLKIKKTKWSA